MRKLKEQTRGVVAAAITLGLVAFTFILYLLSGDDPPKTYEQCVEIAKEDYWASERGAFAKTRYDSDVELCDRMFHRERE